MGKLRVFEVNFDGGVDLFKAGDWVQGSVKIVLSEKKTDIRGKLMVTLMANGNQFGNCKLISLIFSV